MVTDTPADYPRPSSWRDFERLSLNLLSHVYQAKMRRWSRAVERRDGVDGWAKLPDGRVVAFHCKGRTGGFGHALTRDEIESALRAAAGFPHAIDEFIFLTTAPDDADLAAYAAGQSIDRQAQGRSSVAVWGWQTIARHIAATPQVRGAFDGGNSVSPLKRRFLMAAATVLLVAGGAGSLFLGKNAYDSSQGATAPAPADIGALIGSVAALHDTYGKCAATLTGGVFTFGHALRAECRDPAAQQVTALTKQVDKLRTDLDKNVLAELTRMLVIFNEDAREAAVVTAATHTFEKAVIRDMKAGCAPDKQTPAGADALEAAGAQAMTAQLRYYFLLRDFILPGMETAKTILDLHARQLAGAAVPNDMQAAANRMQQLLTERSRYTFAAPRQPFTLSAAKQTAARDAVASGPAAAEHAHWQQVRATSAEQSLYGRADDIEALIACGALKPVARSWGAARHP